MTARSHCPSIVLVPYTVAMSSRARRRKQVPVPWWEIAILGVPAAIFCVLVFRNALAHAQHRHVSHVHRSGAMSSAGHPHQHTHAH